MHIRDATISDLPRLVDIWLTAHADDRDYTTVYPWRTTSPGDFRRFMTTTIEDAFLQGEERYLVAVADTASQPVVAWVTWTRNGSSDAAREIRARNDSCLKGLERRFRALEEAIIHPFTKMLGIPAAPRSPGPLDKLYFTLYKKFRDRLWVGELEEHWFVKRLCVDPAWRRQGVGMMLLQWGLDRAQEENVVVGLDATDEGMALYVKAGFVEIARVEVEELDMRVPVLLWRPKAA